MCNAVFEYFEALSGVGGPVVDEWRVILGCYCGLEVGDGGGSGEEGGEGEILFVDVGVSGVGGVVELVADRVVVLAVC